MYFLTQTISMENQKSRKLSTFNSGSVELIFNKVLEFIATLLEYLLGMMLGAIIGWVAGWSMGHIYQNLYEPVYFINFDTVDFWYYLPHTCAQYGAIIGACLSVPVVYIALRQNFNLSSGDIE